MTQALFTSMTGLNAGTEQLTVVSDNVANMNTTAYKTSRVDFQDIWYKTKTTGTNSTVTTGGTNPYQIGVGVKCASISKDFQPSTVNTTGRATDMAITGPGWFTVLNSDGKMLLTRDGTFALDENGYLCTANGFKVLGTDAAASMLNSTTPIKLPTSIKVEEYPTKGSQEVRSDDNSKYIQFKDIKLTDLNALGTTHSGITEGTFFVDITDGPKVMVTFPEGSITEGTTVDDLCGLIKQANMKEWDETNSKWIDAQDEYLTAEVSDEDDEATNGRIILKSSTGESMAFHSGSSNFVTATGIASVDQNADDTYYSKVLNYTATISQMDDITSDTTRMYESFSVGLDGTITVTYSDGSTLTAQQEEDGALYFTFTDANGHIIIDNNGNTGQRPLYVDPNVLVLANMQMQLAKVTNDYGLVAEGNNQYSIGVDCGDVIYTKANVNGVGAVSCGALETSNVDLAQQFAYMILAQRLVQANSQVFQGANQMLQTLTYLAQ